MAATNLTLTNLIPTFYEAMDIVARERVGLVTAVSRDSSAERAAKDQFILSPVVGAMAAEDLEVDNTSSSAGNQTISDVEIKITKARSVPFGVNAEQQRGLINAGTYAAINRDRVAQAIRTLSNEIEGDLAALHIGASRAYGTAAGTPFGTAGDLSDFAAARQILTANGAPLGDLHMVLGETSVAQLRGKQSTLFKVNEAGSDELLRTGEMGRVQGFSLHESAQIKTSTPGTTTATVNADGYAVGATTFTVTAAASALVAGDIITFAGDPNQYVVKSAVGGASSTFTIQEPGLKVAMVGAKAITVIGSTKRNMFFHRSAIHLVTRAPAMPMEGDMADDVELIPDPVSGIVFEFAVYRQKRQVRYEVNAAWGQAVANPRYLGLLIGA